MLTLTRDPRPLVEATPRIELRTVLRSLDVRPFGTVCRWNDGGVLWAAVRRDDGAGRIVVYFDAATFERAEIAFTHGRGWFGPRRVFRCPRCGASVRALYARGRALACRRCHGLAWASQRMTPARRELAARQRLAAALGIEDKGDPECGDIALLRCGGRPHGMRYARYGRLSAELARLSEASAARFANDCFAVFSGQRRARSLFPDGYTHTVPRLRSVPEPRP